MTNGHDETLVRAAFGPARTLEPTDAEVAHVLTRLDAERDAPRLAEPRRSHLRVASRRVAAAGLATLAVLASAYAAAPPVRAAVQDVAGTFADWLGRDAQSAPGRALGEGEYAPDYFHGPAYSDQRVVAEADGYKLYAAREAGGGVHFNLGDTGVALTEVSASVFRHRVIYVLGPGSVRNADEHGHVPLFGITARTVKSVRLTYESGPPLRVAAATGGFVLLAEPDRRPRAVVALDADGRELGRQLVDDSEHYGPRIDWTWYGPPSPRVPARCLPGVAGPTPPPDCPTR
jgi:hypothetical protein